MERSRSAELHSSKIYLTHLGQLLSKKVVQPEAEVSNKLFPVDKLSPIEHRRAKSSILMRIRKAELPLKQRESKPLSSPAW
jgi:hypothetical protein